MSKLTDEQIEAIYKQETGALIDDSPWALVDFSRAIEAAACAERDARIAELEERNRDLYEDVQRFKEHAQNEKDARLALERQLEQARKDVKPCPTCESLARAVMLDQTGKA